LKIENLDILSKLQNINTNLKNPETNLKSFEDVLKAAQQSKDSVKLKAACEQFEAVFIQMMMKNMRNTVQDGGFIEKSYAREMFEGMFDEEIAKEVAKGQGIGISQMMYDQLSQSIKKDEE